MIAQTADPNKIDPADKNVTLQIRRDVERDKSLSTYAHNVKIIVQHGTATLKGAVRSDAEKQTVLGYAQKHAGSGHVVDQLAVEPR
jgi:osmotically-inducible protein OsmY